MSLFTELMDEVLEQDPNLSLSASCPPGGTSRSGGGRSTERPCRRMR